MDFFWKVPKNYNRNRASDSCGMRFLWSNLSRQDKIDGKNMYMAYQFKIDMLQTSSKTFLQFIFSNFREKWLERNGWDYSFQKGWDLKVPLYQVKEFYEYWIYSTGRLQSTPKDPIGFQRIIKDSNEYQRISKDSKGFQKIP